MAVIKNFKRTEKKYILSHDTYLALREMLQGKMQEDEYGWDTICSLYLDTDNFDLIRRSIDKPLYKEKLRMRSYGVPDGDKKVYIELKKKYDGVVYKRRVALPESSATDWLTGRTASPVDTQISREIDYFMKHYEYPKPAMFLSYEREAYYEREGGDFRITFDDNILCRQTDISLCAEAYGYPILPEGRVLMEIKCPGAIPLWMVKILSEERIYKTPFSKYGTAYLKTVLPKLLEKNSKETYINA